LVVEFDIFNPPGIEQDFHSAWMKLKDSIDAQLVWTTSNGGHWLPLSGKALAAIFPDYKTYSSRYATVPRERAEAYHSRPQTLDPPEHRAFRMLLTESFSRSRINALSPVISGMAGSAIEAFRDRGSCDFMAEFASVLPINVFLTIVDLPLSDAKLLKPWADQVARPADLTLPEIYDRFTSYLLPHMEERRKRPADDLISRLVNGQIDGRRVTHDEAVDLCCQVMFAGLDTVASLLGFVMHFLACNPGHRRALVADPGIIPAAVEEFVRRFPIATPGRVVSRDHDCDGIQLKAGDIVMMPTMVHGLDGRIYPDPLRVDFHRGAVAECTFGAGIHQCPGQVLARAELRITLEEWLPRIPDFVIEPGAAISMVGGQVGLIKALPLQWELPPVP
jgi:cytochrome P450